MLLPPGTWVARWAALFVPLILTGVLMNMDIYFRPTSLWGTIIMFGLIVAGLGVFARGLRPHARK